MAYNNENVRLPLESDHDQSTAVLVVSTDCNNDLLMEKKVKDAKAEMDMDFEEVERENWTNGLDFVLSLVGYAVGVSNLWRFPYLCLRNGGGAFLIPFFFFLLLAGLPLFYLEVCLGQFSGISSIFVWRMCPIFKGIGYGMVIVSGFACIYYNAVLSWVIYYLVNSFQADLPWSSCGHWWNTPTCYVNSSPKNGDSSNQTAYDLSNCELTPNLIMRWPLSSLNLSFDLSSLNFIANDTGKMASENLSPFNYTIMEGILNLDLYSLVSNMTNSSSMNNSTSYFAKCCNESSLCLLEIEPKREGQTAGKEFWKYNVLRKTDGLDNLGSLQLHSCLCLLAAWVLVCLCLIKGVKSLGKVVYVTALLPYLLLTIFLIRGLMLPGALDGIIFYVKPDFTKLANFNVWIEACLQVFYSLGPAWGGLITMASFNKFDNNCFRDVMIATLADGLTSFYGGFVVFAVVGFMAHEAQTSVTKVATEGPGLALVAYPEAISKLPFPQLWAVLFFLMLLLLGLDSQFGMFETVVAGFIDAFPQQLRKKRILLTFSLALISFFISLPLATQGGIYVFTLLDWYVAAFCVMFISLLECIIIAWIYGCDRFGADIHLMLGHYPNLFFKVCWAFVTPVVMLIAFVTTCVTYKLPVYDNYIYPNYANAIGFIISFIPLTPILIIAVIIIVREKGSLSQRLHNALRPASTWGPALRKYKILYCEQQSKYSSQSKFNWITSLFRGGRNL